MVAICSKLMDVRLKMNGGKKSQLLNKVSMKSEKVTQLTPIGKLSPIIRLKQDYTETLVYSVFFFNGLRSIAEVYQACMNYSQTNNVESGGYIFPD
jgi:hypothetical protein